MWMCSGCRTAAHIKHRFYWGKRRSGPVNPRNPYRVYYGREGWTVIILLGGGGKRRQDADIAAALERWKRYKQTRA